MLGNTTRSSGFKGLETLGSTAKVKISDQSEEETNGHDELDLFMKLSG